jgi:hypothetical protein
MDDLTRHAKVCRVCQHEEPLSKCGAATVDPLPEAVSSCHVFRMLYRKWQAWALS